MKKNLFTAAKVVYFGVAFLLLFGLNGKAYLDPSALTYAIQGIAGAAIACGAFVGSHWRRAKKKARDALGIDEKRKKEAELDESDTH